VKVEKFKSIFEGLDIAYGQHQPQGSRADGKQQGKSYMVRKEVTHELWEKHLEGEGPSLGIIPIRADNTTKWGCLDIDTYPLDHRSLITRIRKLGLPLVYCKSKSGGAHLFLFMKNPIASKLVRTKLIDMAASLGQSDSEVFPKQSGIQPEKGDLGNFLNLPYFHSDKSVRYAIKDNATAATIEEFFEMYEKYSVSDIDSIGAIKSEDIVDGPPCLQALCSQGFPEGGRNNGLFNLGVYLKKFDDQNWEEMLVKHNLQYMKPPLPHTEVSTLIKTLNKKDYQYKCKDQPIAPFCNVTICKSRKHGVGAANVSLQLGSLSKLCTEPPIWFLEIPSENDPHSDLKLQLTTEELQIQTKFQKRCMEVINIMPPLMKAPDWQQLINSKMAKALLIQVSNDGSVSGQFLAHLQEFCTDRAQARNKEDILLRKPWTESNMEEVKGKMVDVRRTFFRLKDLHAYLLRQKFTHYTNTGQIIAEVRKLDGLHKFIKLKGQGVNVWGIPAFNPIDSEHAIQEQDEIPF